VALKLYVLFVDDGPTRFIGEPPLERVEVIEMTKDQEDKLKPKVCGVDSGVEFYETRYPISLQEK
jgi:hypothetical protein